jgi:hypothetical protein
MRWQRITFSNLYPRQFAKLCRFGEISITPRSAPIVQRRPWARSPRCGPPTPSEVMRRTSGRLRTLRGLWPERANPPRTRRMCLTRPHRDR